MHSRYISAAVWKYCILTMDDNLSDTAIVIYVSQMFPYVEIIISSVRQLMHTCSNLQCLDTYMTRPHVLAGD